MNGLFNLMMAHPAFGQRFRPMQGQAFQQRGQMQQPGGYDSSGINPHGMYTGGFQHPRQMPQPTMQPQMPKFPANPGGFQPMSLAALFRQYA